MAAKGFGLSDKMTGCIRHSGSDTGSVPTAALNPEMESLPDSTAGTACETYEETAPGKKLTAVDLSYTSPPIFQGADPTKFCRIVSESTGSFRFSYPVSAVPLLQNQVPVYLPEAMKHTAVCSACRKL